MKPKSCYCSWSCDNPRVIFADEPTSSLDDCNTQKVMELILDQTKQMKSTLIVSTHDKKLKNIFLKLLRCHYERFKICSLFIKISFLNSFLSIMLTAFGVSIVINFTIWKSHTKPH